MRRFPGVIRIVLSGQSDQEAIVRSVGAAHQYLSKPCDSETLKESVARAQSLRHRLENDALRAMVGRVGALPSLPDAYACVMAELQSPSASIRRVAELMSQDVAMSAQLLHLANASVFGLPQRVESPAHAASMLGLNTLKLLTLSAGILSQFQSQLPHCSLDEFTEHSLTVSAWAKCIAAECEPGNQHLVDEALLAGLLHDVGQLILADGLPDRYAEVSQSSKDDGLPLHEAERALLGSTHAEIGAYLLGLWRLPAPIVEAVAFHHEPGQCPSNRFSALAAVYIAEGILQEVRPLGDVSGTTWDHEYLASVQLADRWPEWRARFQSSLTEATA
jgi:HD-like signal output (HDOD) protein